MFICIKLIFFFIFCLSFAEFTALAGEKLRVLTWEGYITKNDIKNINGLFSDHKLDMKVDVLQPYSSGPDQMFNVIRGKQCDVSFLTLFFIKMNRERITELLEPINVKSERFTNYKYLIPSSVNIEMGMKNGKPLYIPYGGGVYGFYADVNRIKSADIPKSVGDLWDDKWRGKISLNKTQIWYNIGIALMALGYPPFYLNDLLANNKRGEAIKLTRSNGSVLRKVSSLYRQAGHFWSSGTVFQDNLQIVSSWGPEIKRRNLEKKEKWKKIKFAEGDIVWLDTINFIKGISKKKTIAAEIFANYFLAKKQQNRVVNELSMIAVSNQVNKNPLMDEDPNLFKSTHFVPPYSKMADNLMQNVSKEAFKHR